MTFEDFTMDDQAVKPRGRQTLRRWFKSASNRTFIVYPVMVFALEFALQGGIPAISAELRDQHANQSQRILTSLSTCLNSLSPVTRSDLRSFASAAAKQSA